MDRYEVVAEIGQGAFGAVYKGRDRSGGGEVAIKMIEISTDQKRVYPEIHGLQNLPAHPNVVQLLDVCFPKENTAAIVMEFCDCDMGDYYKKNSVRATESVGLMKQCMKGLKHLHQHGVIHRDLKPWNILMKGGVAKITDFGLAKLVDVDPAISAKYMEQYMTTWCGTYVFMAPELKAGKRYNKSVDIYAMGVTFSWMNDNGQKRDQRIKQLADEMASEDKSKRPSVTEVLDCLDGI